MHQGFDNNTYINDIAILKLNRPAVFNTYVWPICLPPPRLDAVNESAVIIGKAFIYLTNQLHYGSKELVTQVPTK